MANQVIMSILLLRTQKPLHCGCTTLLQLPDNNFKTRLYDGRSPYITNSYFDYSTPITRFKKNYIRRHRLQKKDPSAAKVKQ
jgi:hypothetical protein